jgi:glycosyltransferase involved in cell wall biosynthesis
MKVSIVTGTYNSAEFVKSCIESVNSQDYPDIEHIIIDGASKDNTVQIIKDSPNRVVKIVSEPDKGIYDAMNKGLKLATGDIVAILNSDDFYNSNQVISTVVKLFKEKNLDCLYGNLFYVNQNNPDIVVRNWSTGEYNLKKGFKNGWHPAHPTFFVANKVYHSFGYFNLDFRIAADFELMLRFIEKHKVKSDYLNQPIVRMRLGGESNKSLKNIMRGNKECIKAFKVNNLPVSLFYPFLRLVPKLKQFLK